MLPLRLGLASQISKLPAPALLFLACLLYSTGCQTMNSAGTSGSLVSTQSPGASIHVSPNSANLTSGSQLQFTALVSNTKDTAVQWSANGGVISNSGSFSAPQVSAPQTITIVATGSNQQSRGTATVFVTPAQKLRIVTLSLPPVESGAPYSTLLTGEGGSTPYQWNVQSGRLPSGLALETSAGIISGSTSETGTFPFTIHLRDRSGNQGVAAMALTVSAVSNSNFDGPAELPRVYLQTTLADTPAPGKTTLVNTASDFQDALNAAICGDTIQLQTATTFTGVFVFPNKHCDGAHWIIVRTSAPDTSLPPEGTRISPCSAGVTALPGRPALNCKSSKNLMARLVVPMSRGDGPVMFASGANHYRLIGLEITRATQPGSVSELITAERHNSADHIIVDRCWVHGTPQDETTRGVDFAGVTSGAVIDSFFTDFHCVARTGTCIDSQAVAGGLGDLPSGPFKITNNFMEAAGENILFGGGEATVVPADIEVRHNYLFKPMIWMQGQADYVGGRDGNPFIVKNHFELKNAQRVLFEGNVAEYTWGGFTQQGYSILLTPKNQAGAGATNVCPACLVADVTIRYSRVSHAASGMQIATMRSDNHGQGLGGQRISVHDITFDDISSRTYQGDGAFFLITNSWSSHVLQDVSIRHVTGFGDPTRPLAYVGDHAGLPKMSGLVFTNNILVGGQSAISSTGGEDNCAIHNIPLETFNTCFSSYVFSGNALIATSSAFPSSKWPQGNFFPPNPQALDFVDYNGANGGNYRLLPSSRYYHAATDGKSLGADIDLIDAAIAGVQP
jgi:Putative Ig domain